MRTRNLIGIVAFVAVAGLLLGCGGQAAEETKTADLAYVNWAEGVAYTHLAKVILEDKLGYEVTITAADAGPAYTSVAQGDKDAFMETWLPVLHKDYVEQYKDKVVDLGHVYEGTQSGWVVPSYVTIDRIAELADHVDEFDGKITGIDAGAGVMKTSEQVLEMYGLENYELVSSSGPAMTAALSKAIDEQEWIVVTGWRPHWMFGRWDLKFLQQDEDKMVWTKGNIHIMGRLGLEEEKPELAQFLKNYFFTDAQLSDLMLKMNDAEDLEAAARTWMNENPDVVASWLPQ